MSVQHYFAGSYQQARRKFKDAASKAGAQLDCYTLPNFTDEQGQALTTDVAALGSDNPDTVLLLISATHGVEGFCGSGCQVGFFEEQLIQAMPAHTRVIHIHALNPYGFCYLRRVNEDNIDLNRNFVDFSSPLPDSTEYEGIHHFIAPNKWNTQVIEETALAIESYIQTHSMAKFQAVISQGQYTVADGLFYGGTQASWSNKTLHAIVKKWIPKSVNKLAVIDFHSGLGPAGYGEPIHHSLGAFDFEQSQQCYGPEVTCSQQGNSSSSALTGILPDSFQGLVHQSEVNYIAMEYGTLPIFHVLNALRADNWLHSHNIDNPDIKAAIKKQILDAFYVDSNPWRAAVFGRAADFIVRASHWLAK